MKPSKLSWILAILWILIFAIDKFEHTQTLVIILGFQILIVVLLSSIIQKDLLGFFPIINKTEMKQKGEL